MSVSVAHKNISLGCHQNHQSVLHTKMSVSVAHKMSVNNAHKNVNQCYTQKCQSVLHTKMLVFHAKMSVSVENQNVSQC